MALTIATKRPECVLGKGEESGFEWIVLAGRCGYRCGYIKVPLVHPWYGTPYLDIDCEVHGGLTYANSDSDSGRWFGFDCQHLGDAPDPALRHLAESDYFYDDFYGHPDNRIRSQEYVESHCRSLCQQAAAARSLTAADHKP